MDNPIETFDHEGVTVKIYYDQDAHSPSSMSGGDENAFLVHYHRDFWEENKIAPESALRDIYRGENTETTRDLKKRFHIFPVSSYIHSGVVLSLSSSFACDSQGWDTSHVGAIFLSKTEWKRKDGKALSYAKGMIEEWNHYLSGEVYGFELTDKHDNHLDSCWGFIGDIEYAKSEAIGSAKYFADEIKKKKQDKLKAMIKNHVPLKNRELLIGGTK